MAWQYRLRWDTDPAFSSPDTIDGITTPSHEITGLQPGTTYYVQVAVREAPEGEWSEWSDAESATTDAFVGSIDADLVLDADAAAHAAIRATVETDLVLDAEATAQGATRYALDWDTTLYPMGPNVVTAEALDADGNVIDHIDRTFEVISSLLAASIDADLVLDADAAVEIPTVVDIETDLVLDADIDAETPVLADISGDLVLDAESSAASRVVIREIDSDLVLDAGISAQIEIIREPYFGLRMDIGPLGSPPVATIAPIIAASYRMAEGEISEWSAQLPPAGANVDLVTDGMEVRIIRDGEGQLIRGVINDIEHELTDGGPVLAVSGEGVERELVWHNTLLGREFASAPVSSAVNTLLQGTGWSAGDVAATGEVTGRFEGASGWEALRAIAESQGLALRARSDARQVDLSELGTQRPLRFIGVETVHQDYDRDTVPVRSLALSRSSPDVWTRVIPLGGGEQISVLTLQHATRNTPYTIHSATGPDGRPYWYLQDDAAVAEYGLRTRVIKFDDVSPLSNSFAEVRRAANALYDLAAAWLQHRAHRQETWSIEVPSFRHRNPLTNEWNLLPGDRALLRYRGVATAMDGHKRVWADINEMAWCRSLSRNLNADGTDDWTLEMASSLHIVDDDSVLAETVENIWALATSTKHSVIETQAGPFFDSIDNGFPVRLGVIYDEDIRYLHRAKLSVQRYPIRADAKGASSGGGQTRTTSTQQQQTPTTSTQQQQTPTTSTQQQQQRSTSDGGGTFTATGQGSAHRHAINDQTTGLFNAHRHEYGQIFGTSAWTDPPFQHSQELMVEFGNVRQQTVGRGSSASGAFLFTNQHDQFAFPPVTESGPESEHTHPVEIPDHQHTVTIPSHSHTVTIPSHNHTVTIPSHDHSVTIQPHTHNLEYGIHQGSLPSNPGFQVWINGVNRTSALGGPWNSNTFDVDITPFLVDAQGYVNQQRNTVEIRANNLQRIEVSVRSLCTVASVVPI